MSRELLNDAPIILTVNIGVGGGNLTMPVGNLCSQNAQVMIYGPPLRERLFIYTFGCYTNFTTQLQPLLLLNGLTKHNLRPYVGFSLTIDTVYTAQCCLIF